MPPAMEDADPPMVSIQVRLLVGAQRGLAATQKAHNLNVQQGTRITPKTLGAVSLAAFAHGPIVKWLRRKILNLEVRVRSPLGLRYAHWFDSSEADVTIGQLTRWIWSACSMGRPQVGALGFEPSRGGLDTFRPNQCRLSVRGCTLVL